MPLQDPNATREQVSFSTARSTRGAQAKEDVEAILAMRKDCPSPHKDYDKVRDYTRHNKSKYEPGTIIVVRPIYQKKRPAIVVAKLDNSFLVVPMLTYGRRGLQGMEDHEKDEHMSVCDQREGGYYWKQNDMPVLLTDLDMRGTLIDPKRVVHYTERFNFLYSHKTTILGKLCEYSTEILLEHYRRSAARPARLVRDPWPTR